MPHCACGGRLARIHRTLREKFRFIAVYRCESCGHRTTYPRSYLWYLALETRCPRCRTPKLKRLAEPDAIDPMIWNLVRAFRFLFPTRLYHCRFCRIQFYDVERGSTSRPARDQDQMDRRGAEAQRKASPEKTLS